MWGNQFRVSDFLRAEFSAALSELKAIDADTLLTENPDVIVAALLQKHLPERVNIDWDAAERSEVKEVTTQMRDQFGADRTYTIPSSRVIISFPIIGCAELLEYPASTMSTGINHGKISGNSLVLEITERTLTKELVQDRIASLRKNVEQRAGWANADLERFIPQAESELRANYEARKNRILNDRAVVDALGIPVKATGRKHQPVPAQRKQISLATRRQQSAFVPEPALEEAVYQDVLSIVHGWARNLERVSGTTSKLDEEELRDLLLSTLNGYWLGAAGGELFNGKGKTDILIREGDRNAFIAECKFWRGPKSVTEAIDQLLGYLVWRDSKAALIVFITTANPSATIEKLHAAVEAHPRHALTKPGGDPAKQINYILTADDEGRRISVAVLPVILSLPAEPTT